MKKVVLFSLLVLAVVFTAKAMLSSNQAMVEEPVLILEESEDDMACHWCVHSGMDMYCATANTCGAARSQAERMARKK